MVWRCALAALAALLPASSSAQVRAVAKVAAPWRGPVGPALGAPHFTNSLVPQLQSMVPAPSLTAPMPKVGLQAAPIVQTMEAPGPAPVAAEDQKFQDSMAAAMTMQSQVLGSISRATGFDPLVLSLGMSMLREGLSAKDWLDIGAGLQDRDSDWDEMDKVLAQQMRSPQFSEGFRKGQKISPDDLTMLAWTIKDLPREVEIARNNQYLGWQYRWEAGDASAAGASFKNASVKRLSKDSWMIDLGAIPGPQGAQRLRFSLEGFSGRAADAKPQLDALLSSPLLTPEQRADLLRLALRLEAEGLLPKGYSQSRSAR
ncbi:MAG: hypothetical protein NTY77_13035 [Elusimicrobia bacterium]|nr:hypothetical protein [Elusimicrobiota bacterium]